MITRTVLILLVTTVTASADPLPMVKTGSCPAGWYSGALYCVPMVGTKRDAVPKVGQCPSGWITSGSYCLGPERRDR